MPKPLARPQQAMVVAGVMSGTSADGIEVALVRIAAARDRKAPPRIKLLSHRSFPFSAKLRQAILEAASGQSLPAAVFAQLSWRLGEVYADTIERTVEAYGKPIHLAGIHGQTIHHQPIAAPYLGRKLRATWQLGEMTIPAERLRVPIVHDFRPADLAAGGQGAPLVPMLDFCLFRSPTRNRVLLNLGGIANLTAIPAGATLHKLLAFDTGPANMLVDALMHKLYGRPLDRAGRIAASGDMLQPVVEKLLHDPYFSASPPKSCGRELFGISYADRIHALCLKAGTTNADVIATATELTVRSVYDAYTRFCWPHLGQRAPLARATELIVAGGGARNTHLISRLRAAFTPLGVTLSLADDYGIPAEAKEAVAFALLAWLSWHGLPGNVPSATGATRPVVLGKVTCA